MTDNEGVANNQKTTNGAGQSRAVGLFLLKRYEEAIAVYDDLLQQNPTNITFWVNRSICRLQISLPDADFFNDMLKRVNDLPAEGYLCLANTLYDFGRYEESLIFINKAFELNPDNVDVCLLKARILDTLDRSEELYQFVCSFYPRLKRDERILCFVAFYAALFWNIVQSDYFLKKALKVNEYWTLQDQFFYSSLAATDQEKQVISFGLRALDVRLDNPFIWAALGDAYADLEENDNAIKAYETLSKLTEISDDVRLNWANVLIKEKEYQQAFELLKQISDFSDSLFLLIFNMLIEMRQLGKQKEAKEMASFWSMKQGKNADLNYFCKVILEEDQTQSAPLTFIKLINDTYALEQAVVAMDSKKYFGPDILNRVLQTLKIPIGYSMQVLDMGCGIGSMANVLTAYSRSKGALTGIDISGINLDLASEDQLYDTLEETDFNSFCSAQKDRYDLIVAMDSLYYFADLTPVFETVKESMKQKGSFVFTVRTEKTEKDFSSDEYGKYRHNPKFVSVCLQKAGLEEQYQESSLLYKLSETEDVFCHLFAVQKKS